MYIVYRDVSTFLEKKLLSLGNKSDYIPIEMIPHLLRNNYSVWAKNLVTSLDRNASTFLEKEIIQSAKNLVASLYRNDSTFLKTTMFLYQNAFYFVNVNYTE